MLFTATAIASTSSATIAAAPGILTSQSAVVATAVASVPSVVIRDALLNPVVGADVTFSVTGGGGQVTNTTTKTNASGIATAGAWTLGTISGANTLTASSSGVTGSPVTFTATGIAGTATTIAIFTGNAQTAAKSTAVGVAPSVVVKDQFGNPVAGAIVTFAVASGGGSITGANALTNAAGIATIGSWTLGFSAGANSLTATTGALPPVTFTATGS